MKNCVIAVTLDKRTEDAPDVQEIFTRHGCIINVRLGVHELQGCSNKGLIVLVTNGNEGETEQLIKDLKAHPRVKVSALDICS